jgi:O-succinylbenzoic acid--CoA ligase
MRIYIEEKDFDLPDFINYCQHNLHLPKSDDWRRSIYEFFDEWHNSSDFITVNTSGSTGEAKPVTLQKKHVMASARATLQYLNIQPGGLAWLCLPANYIAGKMMIVRALVGGLDLLISKPESLLRWFHLKSAIWQLPPMDST